jgi:hypothetical protein
MGIVRIRNITTHEYPGYNRAEPQLSDQKLLKSIVALLHTPAGHGQVTCGHRFFQFSLLPARPVPDLCDTGDHIKAGLDVKERIFF